MIKLPDGQYNCTDFQKLHIRLNKLKLVISRTDAVATISLWAYTKLQTVAWYTHRALNTGGFDMIVYKDWRLFFMIIYITC